MDSTHTISLIASIIFIQDSAKIRKYYPRTHDPQQSAFVLSSRGNSQYDWVIIICMDDPIKHTRCWDDVHIVASKSLLLRTNIAARLFDLNTSSLLLLRANLAATIDLCYYKEVQFVFMFVCICVLLFVCNGYTQNLADWF